jgi:hypothetical protein
MPPGCVTVVTEMLCFVDHGVAVHRSLEMLKDERDVVVVLKSELAYLKSGAYAEGESWGPRFIFEDSPRDAVVLKARRLGIQPAVQLTRSVRI